MKIKEVIDILNIYDLNCDNKRMRELEEENKLLNKAMRMYINKDITREELEKLAVNANITKMKIPI